jgi:phosphoenolpyruvate carboxykinase (GTP)
MRVLKWAIERIEGTAAAVDTPIGRVPAPGSIDITGLDVTAEDMALALAVDNDEWRAGLPAISQWFEMIGDKVPSALRDELAALASQLD